MSSDAGTLFDSSNETEDGRHGALDKQQLITDKPQNRFVSSAFSVWPRKGFLTWLLWRVCVGGVTRNLLGQAWLVFMTKALVDCYMTRKDVSFIFKGIVRRWCLLGVWLAWKLMAVQKRFMGLTWMLSTASLSTFHHSHTWAFSENQKSRNSPNITLRTSGQMQCKSTATATKLSPQSLNSRGWPECRCMLIHRLKAFESEMCWVWIPKPAKSTAVIYELFPFVLRNKINCWCSISSQVVWMLTELNFSSLYL